jgi:hypothetical protein
MNHLGCHWVHVAISIALDWRFLIVTYMLLRMLPPRKS